MSPGTTVVLTGAVEPTSEGAFTLPTTPSFSAAAEGRTTTPELIDRSGTRYELTDPRWRGDDRSPLMVTPLPGITADQIVTGERSLWRYQAALPITPGARVSLGEGWTP